VSDYVDKLNKLVSDMDLDGTYADKGQAISDLLKSAYNKLKGEVDSKDEEDTKGGSSVGKSEQKGEVDSKDEEDTKGGSSIGKWVWVLVVLGTFMFLLGICFCCIKRRNNRLHSIRLESQMEGYDGKIRPFVHGEPAITAVNSGEGQMF